MAKTPFRLILASGSRGRRELLKQAGYSFEVFPSNVDEPTGVNASDIRRFVHEVAWMKAAAVAPQFGDAVILAADSVGWIDGQVIGKPEDDADARRILQLLAGRKHELWTGVVLWRRPGDVQICWQEASTVTFKGFAPGELEEYLKTRTWKGCSGAYAVQMENDPLIQVQGSISNVVGLPMETLARMLPLMESSFPPSVVR